MLNIARRIQLIPQESARTQIAALVFRGRTNTYGRHPQSRQRQAETPDWTLVLSSTRILLSSSTANGRRTLSSLTISITASSTLSGCDA